MIRCLDRRREEEGEFDHTHGYLQQEERYAIGNGDGVVNYDPLTMAISNRKQDMPSEGEDWVVNWGPLMMTISNRK